MADDARRRWWVPVVLLAGGAWWVHLRRAGASDPWPIQQAGPPLGVSAPSRVPGDAPTTAAPSGVVVGPSHPAMTTTSAAGVETPSALPDDTIVPDPDAPAAPMAHFAQARPVTAGATPLPDGAAPGPEYTIKGNADSMLFHGPGSPYFKRTRAERWFRTPDEARAAGFIEWTPRKRAAR